MSRVASVSTEFRSAWALLAHAPELRTATKRFALDRRSESGSRTGRDRESLVACQGPTKVRRGKDEVVLD